MNGSCCSSLINPTAEKIGKTIGYCLILVVSLVGNSCIAFIVYKTQSMRKPINYFIVNMALSDLLFPILCFPWEISTLYADSWLISGSFGQALCKLAFSLQNASIAVSIQSLVLIAVDRFGAVVFPFRYPLISSKLCPFFILATWIVAVAVTSLPHFFTNEVFRDSSSEAIYLLSVFVVFFYIPMALLAILYSVILIKLKSQKIPGVQSVIAEKRRERRNKNVLKMAVAIVLVLSLSWVPFSVIVMLHNFQWNEPLSNCELELYVNIAWFMACTNCAMNPCICFIFSANYRQALKRLLKYFRKFFCRSDKRIR